MSDQPIAGTVIFDGDEAQKGYALNRMCFSFNKAENRDAFVADEDAYCRKYGLNADQREAIRKRNVLALIAAGGNVYYLAKFAGIFGLNVQDIGAQQTGMTVEAFKQKLVEFGEITDMAHIIGGLGTTHVPAIGSAIAKGLQNDPYWKPFFDGFHYVHKWLAREKPDIVVVFSNDHGLNFFLDKMPTFAVGAADTYGSEDEGCGIPVSHSAKGDAPLSWHIINNLVAEEFDVTTCQEMLIDHAITIPLSLMWPGDAPWPIKVVPVSINTVQHPLASPKRCLALGRAVGRAIDSYPSDAKVMVLGTGGLSHQLDGERAGFINKEFDRLCMDSLVNDPDSLTRYSVLDLVEQAGSQGVEVLNWIAMRGALTGQVTEAHRNYHIPISNTAAATMLLDNRPALAQKAA